MNKIIKWNESVKPLRKLYSSKGDNGIDVRKGLKCLIVQFWEDYSDRQAEKALKENFAVKWFCEFSIGEATPDHSYLGKLRKRIGADRLARILIHINKELRKYGLFGNIFEVIDASAIVTKIALWKERDKAISEGEEKLNNKNVKKYAKDQEARWGVKGKDKVWIGYKRHVSIDTRH